MTLIDRLSKREGPNREAEADAELEAVFVGGRVHYNDPANKEAVIERPIDGFWIRGVYPYRKIARYTNSVDAAIALAERVLPGWNANLDACSLPPMSDTYKADIFNQNGNWRHCIGEGATPAIAICIAILRAKEASKS